MLNSYQKCIQNKESEMSLKCKEIIKEWDKYCVKINFTSP